MQILVSFEITIHKKRLKKLYNNNSNNNNNNNNNNIIMSIKRQWVSWHN